MTFRMKFYHLPLLKSYGAAVISGLTGIVGIFFFKYYLDLPAEFLAMFGFGLGLSLALKNSPESLLGLLFVASDIQGARSGKAQARSRR